MAQTQADAEWADMIEPICSIINLALEHIFPIEPRQKSKIHSSNLSFVDANRTVAERGAAIGRSNMGSSTPSKAEGGGLLGAMGGGGGSSSVFGMPTDMKTFFGGSFFP